MKHSPVTRRWKRFASMGLAFAMAVSLLPAAPAFAAGAETDPTPPAAAADIVPVKDKTPVPDKACSISMDQLENNTNKNDPFPKGTVGSNVFRIPAMITMQNGELLTIADTRYDQPSDGNGLDTIAAISSDGGATWEYGFPFYFPDTYRDLVGGSTAFIDPGLLEGPDGTLYCIADAFPSEYHILAGTRRGTGYVTIGGKKRLALTDNYSNVETSPTDTDDEKYLYYVGDFVDGYALILRRDNSQPTGYAVDEWYNLYTVGEDGSYQDNLKQPQLNNLDHKVQQNVYYKDSKFHVYKTGYLWLITSKDHGRTWEHPRDITPQIKEETELSFLISPGCGLTTSDGKLVIGAYYHGKTAGADEGACLLYSEDNGETWNRTGDVKLGEGTGSFTSENEVTELSDGTIRMFCRNGAGKIAYADFTKDDEAGYVPGTLTLTGQTVTSTCNVTAITYSKKINGKEAILVACPGGGNTHNAGRNHGKIFTFLVNDDKTMECIHTLDVPGGETDFVYSSLTELEDGSIGLLWEEGDRTAQIWFDKFEIGELVPENTQLTLAGLQEETVPVPSRATVLVDKDDTYTVNIPNDTVDPISQSPDSRIATASVAEEANNFAVKVPAYAHTANATEIETAFSTAHTMLNLDDAEFTFTKDTDGWILYNKKKNTYLTVGGSNAYCSSEKNAISVTPQSGGSVRLHSTGYAGLFLTNLAFDRTTAADNSSMVYNFSLWEKAESSGTVEDSRLPGYRKLSVADADGLAGKSCLISVESGGNIFLLWPVNGVNEQVKLIAQQTTDTDAYVFSLKSSYTNDIGPSIDKAYGTDNASNIQRTSLANMEFTFSKPSGEENNGWNIKSKQTGQYMNPAGGDNYFSAEATSITPELQGNGTFRLRTTAMTDTSQSKYTYVAFYQSLHRFEKTSLTAGGDTWSSNTNISIDLTLWEADSTVTDGVVPGYKKLSVQDVNNLDGKNVLISVIYNGLVFLINPVNGMTNQTKLVAPEISVPAYTHKTSNNNLATAFSTADGSTAGIINLPAAEFTFAKSNNQYKIYNEATGQYLTSPTTKANEYFSPEEGVINVELSNGKINIKNTLSNPSYIGFHKTNNMNWNRSGTLPNATDGIYNLTLWKQDSTATDSQIPGYAKVTVPVNGVEDGSYLITAELGDDDKHIVVLSPIIGNNTRKAQLLGDVAQSIERPALEGPSIPAPEIVTQKSVTITGVNEGFTTATIGGCQYNIYVTDPTEYKVNNESFDVKTITSEVSADNGIAATYEIVPNGSVVLHDRNTATSGSIEEKFTATPGEANIEGAEFTFTASETEGHWLIKNESSGKYFLHDVTNSQDDSTKHLFSSEPADIKVEKTADAATYKIWNPAGTKTSATATARYLLLNTTGGKLQFDATPTVGSDSNFHYEMTLWKKDPAVTDGLLPGYRRLGTDDAIESGGIYLISCILTEDTTEHVILLWPQDTNMFVDFAKTLKLAKQTNSVRITPAANTTGKFVITIDDVRHVYQFAAPDCAHDGSTFTKGFASASCETPGYSGDTVCSLCGKVTASGSATAGGHSWQQEVTLQALTENQNGIYLKSCANDKTHQKKITVHASAYKYLKALTSPEEISDAKKALYKADDVTALTNAFNEAQSTAKKDAASLRNEELYGRIHSFAAARKTLSDHRNRQVDELSWAIAAAAPIKDQGKPDGMLQEIWDTFTAALAAATELDKASAPYTDLSKAAADLTAAQKNMTESATKIELQTLYNAYKDKTQNDYTALTWPALKAALENAADVLADENAAPSELSSALAALKQAIAGLRTEADEMVGVPGSIAYTAPSAGSYPIAPSITAADNDTRHATAISDWITDEALAKYNESSETAIVKKDGIWGFNDKLKSDSATYNVNGSDKSMAIAFKLWLNDIPATGTKEIMAKGKQYSLQLMDGKLAQWMYTNTAYPTEQFTLDDSYANCWLDVIMFISGSGHQRLYVNGKASTSRDSKPAGLIERQEPFTIGYRDGGDGVDFTEDDGYLADIRFYNLGGNDVTDGLENSYEQIASRLDALTPDAVISANPADAQTVWTKTGEAEAMDGTEAFAVNNSYKATTTFTANDYFHFPTTEAFRTEVASKVSAGSAQTKVTVSQDGLTMTVEAAYPEITTPVPVPVPVTGISLDKTELTLNEGDSDKLIATLKPENPSNPEVTWTSSDPDTASVAPDGTVTALKEGSATITATALGGQNVDGSPLQATSSVTVTKKQQSNCSCELESLTVSGGTIAIGANDEKGTFQIQPSSKVKSGCAVNGHPDANKVSYGYEVTDAGDTGADVGKDGLVTATASGTAYIRVTASINSGKDGKTELSEVITIKVDKASAGQSTVRFSANTDDEVSGMPEPQVISDGETLAKPSAEPSREGYTFKGWSFTDDGDAIADEQWPLEITGDTTLYAVWEANKGDTVTKDEAMKAANEALSAADSIYNLGNTVYSDDSWNAFREAYDALKEASAAEDADPAEVKRLADSLNEKRGALTVDTEKAQQTQAKAQQAVQNNASAISGGNTEYTVTTWAAYTAAYNALKAEADKGAEADPVKLAELQKTFEEAKAALTTDVSWKNAKAGLTQALSSAKAIYAAGNKNYTADSWKIFADAYAKANAKANAIAQNSTAAELSNLANQLTAAKAGLKTAPPALKKGDSVTKGNLKFVVISPTQKTASVQGVTSKKKKKFAVTIPATVTINGFKCKVTEVKKKGFAKFTKITKVTIGQNVTKIDTQAFDGCKSITSLTVNGNVKTFGAKSFNSCKNLKAITFKGKKVPTFKSGAFKGNTAKVTLKAKKMSKKDQAKLKSKLKKAGLKKIR